MAFDIEKSVLMDMYFHELKEEITETSDKYDKFIDSLETADGWRKVGSALRFTVPDLERFKKKSSPAAAMLTEWETRDDGKLKVLIEALKSSKQNLALRKLTEYVKGHPKASTTVNDNNNHPQPHNPQVNNYYPPVQQPYNSQPQVIYQNPIPAPTSSNIQPPVSSVNPVRWECLFDYTQIPYDEEDTLAYYFDGRFFWPKNYELKVYFMESTPLDDWVMNWASEWSPHSFVKIVKTTDITQSHIRIKYYEAGSTVLGTLAMADKHLGKPTMFLDQLLKTQDNLAQRKIVLHEFGHALGLVHEHHDLSCEMPWNVTGVFEQFKKFGWDEYKTQACITRPKFKSNQQQFDKLSIMRTPFPESNPQLLSVTQDWVKFGLHNIPQTLSESDKQIFSRWFQPPSSNINNNNAFQ